MGCVVEGVTGVAANLGVELIGTALAYAVSRTLADLLPKFKDDLRVWLVLWT